MGESIHEKIERIWKNNVDHIHADYLHQYVDKQHDIIKELEADLNESRLLYSECKQLYDNARTELEEKGLEIINLRCKLEEALQKK